MKRKPAWERILLPLLFLWAIPVYLSNEETEVEPVLREYQRETISRLSEKRSKKQPTKPSSSARFPKEGRVR